MGLGAMLDVAIGVIFIYLLLSLLVTAINEYVASFLDQRSRYLLDKVEQMLGGDQGGWSALTAKVWNNPVIGALKTRQPIDPANATPRELRKNAPSYVPAPAFALAVIDALKPDGVADATLADIKTQVDQLPDSQVKAVLLSLIASAGGDLAAFRTGVATWFDLAMDRASGAFKRWSHVWTFWLGVTLALMFNVNTLTLVGDLWRDPVARAVVVAEAEQLAQPALADDASAQPGAQPGAQPDDQAVKAAVGQLTAVSDKLPLPLGWTPKRACELVPAAPACHAQASPGGWPLAWTWITTLVGLLITGLAVSLGSPFWFGVLQNVTNIRAAGTKPSRADGTRQK